MFLYLKRVFSLLFFLISTSLFGDINESFVKPKYIYLKYENIPKKVYQLEEFILTINANILYKDFFIIDTKLNSYENIRILDDFISWKRKNNFYTANIRFKLFEKKPSFPMFTISLLDENETIIDVATLKKIKPDFIDLSKEKSFCKVVADDFKVLFVKTKQLSNNEFLTYIEISAKNSNLEDFLLDYKQTKNLISNNNGIKTITLSITTPIYLKELYFKYFNKKENNFINVTIPLILQEDIISTQEDINPTNNDLLIYKQLILGGFVTILLLFYFFYKKRFILFIDVLIIIYLINISLPNPKIKIAPNEKIYILPTSNSQVFKITDEEIEVKLLLEKDNYKKILLPNGNIGWIKDEK